MKGDRYALVIFAVSGKATRTELKTRSEVTARAVACEATANKASGEVVRLHRIDAIGRIEWSAAYPREPLLWHLLTEAERIDIDVAVVTNVNTSASKKRSIASLRRDVFHALTGTLQGDLDNGSEWIAEEQDGTPSSEYVTGQREMVVRQMRDEFARKGKVSL